MRVQGWCINVCTPFFLQVSALVAVVQLGASQQALRPEDVVQWAEIVPCSARDGRDRDFESRARGRMALRLLSRSDCPSLPREASAPLTAGGRVAVIDLRVFVPEVVAVLGTFADNAFGDHLAQIPFVASLIGQAKPAAAHVAVLDVVTPRQQRRAVEEALRNSDIDLLHQLGDLERQDLAQRICTVKPVQLLYGTQLQAFLAALSQPIHVTQGPPGTGKVPCCTTLLSLSFTLIMSYPYFATFVVINDGIVEP